MSAESNKDQSLIPVVLGLPSVSDEQRMLRVFSHGSLEEKKEALEKMKDPKVFERVMTIWYHDSGFRETRLVAHLSSRLTDIRQNYPNFISYFSEDKCTEILSRYPIVGQRIDSAQNYLKQISEEEVKASELILGILINDASIRVPNAEEYRDVKSSHELLCALHDEAERDGSIALTLEMRGDKFIAIGQGLGKLTRSEQAAIQRRIDEGTRTQEGHQISKIGEEGLTDEQIAWELIKAERHRRGIDNQIKRISDVISLCTEERNKPFQQSLKGLMQELIGEKSHVGNGMKMATTLGQPQFSKAEYWHHPNE